MNFDPYFVFEIIGVMKFLDFLDVVRTLYKHEWFHDFHRISFLRDHQELACTPKDPRRPVDMKEINACFI